MTIELHKVLIEFIARFKTATRDEWAAKARFLFPFTPTLDSLCSYDSTRTAAYLCGSRVDD